MENHEYKTGDILHATAAPPTLGLLGHKGIILLENNEIYVYHNTPIDHNEWGGSTMKDTLEDFLVVKRQIKSIDRSNLTEAEIKARFDQVKNKKFRWISWNCDHFINVMITGEHESPQLKKILSTIFLVVSFYLITKYIKK